MTDPKSNPDDALVVALEALPLPAAILRRSDRTLVFANRLVSTLMGVEPEALLGAQPTQFGPHAKLLDDVDRRLNHNDLVPAQELAATTPDGRQLWLLVSFRSVEYQGVPSLLLSAVDITGRKHAQQHLRTMLEIRERDRRWVGMELHDGITQEMAAALMFLEASLAELQRDEPDKARECIEQSAVQLRRALDDARSLINGLRPPVLNEHGLGPALENLCRELSALDETEYKVTIAGARSLPRDLEAVLYRIVQEATSNARKHSQANQVHIGLTLQPQSLLLNIADDGVGLQSGETAPLAGVGLTSIRERIELLDGSLEIVPNGQLGGVELRMRIPLLLG